ncbi:unnamed protein product [Cutaneotrichosporon oleaginosum]
MLASPPLSYASVVAGRPPGISAAASAKPTTAAVAKFIAAAENIRTTHPAAIVMSTPPSTATPTPANNTPITNTPITTRPPSPVADNSALPRPQDGSAETEPLELSPQSEANTSDLATLELTTPPELAATPDPLPLDLCMTPSHTGTPSLQSTAPLTSIPEFPAPPSAITPTDPAIPSEILSENPTTPSAPTLPAETHNAPQVLAEHDELQTQLSQLKLGSATPVSAKSSRDLMPLVAKLHAFAAKAMDHVSAEHARAQEALRRAALSEAATAAARDEVGRLQAVIGGLRGDLIAANLEADHQARLIRVLEIRLAAVGAPELPRLYGSGIW